MSCFLWVEDFEGGNYKATTDSVFGEMLNPPIPDEKEDLRQYLEQQGITLKFNFLEALHFIRDPQKLTQVDCIILDIDLPVKTPETTEDEKKLLPDVLKLYGYQVSKNEEEDEASSISAQQKLKQKAGYQLYVELIFKQSFPKNHIFICSNHGENLKSILAAFEQAKMEIPEIVEKNDKKCADWVKEWKNKSYHNLRRGIIEGCQSLKKELKKLSDDKKNPQFTEYQKSTFEPSVIEDYLEMLERFLPLREPHPEEKKHQLKLFARTLVHLWETKATPHNLNRLKLKNELWRTLSTLGWIMKSARNLMAHGSLLDQLDEQDVAFLFLINMRAMFDLGEQSQSYEKILLRIFHSEPFLNDSILESELANSYYTVKDLVKKTEKTSDSLHFNGLVKNLAEAPKLKGNPDFIRFLYQIFWHGLSGIRMELVSKKEIEVIATYKFNMKSPIFEPSSFESSSYSEMPFLNVFAHHFYHKSFGKGQ